MSFLRAYCRELLAFAFAVACMALIMMAAAL